jgi:hypothetical protein
MIRAFFIVIIFLNEPDYTDYPECPGIESFQCFTLK